MVSFIKRALNYVKKFIYTKQIFFIYKKCNDVIIELPAEVKQVDKSNLQDALSFNDEAYMKIFNDFIDQGDKGYYAYLNGECVHRSWVKRGPKEILLTKGYSRFFSENDVYIHYCATAEKARGKNIYPYILSHICNELQNQNVYVLVLEKKLTARRGVEKAGFQKVKRVLIRRVFGFTRIEENVLNH